jgi:hypothetical protein
MRKILLAATAVAAVAGTAGAAFAQTAAPPPVPANRAPWVGAKFSGYPGATNEPGTIQVYLRGALYSGIFIGGASGDTVQASAATGGGTTKNLPYAFYNYLRLYPSFQGTTAQGMMYGAFGEIRSTAGNTSAGSNNSTSVLVWRRAYGYIGGSWGQVRFGSIEGANYFLQTGTFENGTGLENGDAPAYAGPAAFTWPFLGTSGTGEKIIYMSPSFGGFDFAAAFEPSSNTTNTYAQPGAFTTGAGSGNFASLDGVRLDSISGTTFLAANGNLRRPKNTLELVGRYQGNLGPVGVTASLGIISSSLVKNNGLTGLTNNGSPQYKYKNPFGVQGGLTVSYGGLTVGGAIYGGSVNPTNSRNQGPVKSGERDALAFLLGASYATGPFSITGSIVSLNRAGIYAQDLAGPSSIVPVANGNTPGSKTGLARELGYGIAGTYAYGPGASLNVDFVYSQRHQANVNLFNNSYGRTSNNVQHVALIINNAFVW